MWVNVSVFIMHYQFVLITLWITGAFNCGIEFKATCDSSLNKVPSWGTWDSS